MKVPRQVGLLVWVCAAAAAARFDPAAFQLFLVISLFAFIARNLGERRGGLSAYSVFNPGCQPILGQINAEQFDAEIRHRPTGATDERRRARVPTVADGNEDLLESVRREIMQEQRRARRTMPAEPRPRRRK